MTIEYGVTALTVYVAKINERDASYSQNANFRRKKLTYVFTVQFL